MQLHLDLLTFWNNFESSLRLNELRDFKEIYINEILFPQDCARKYCSFNKYYSALNMYFFSDNWMYNTISFKLILNILKTIFTKYIAYFYSLSPTDINNIWNDSHSLNLCTYFFYLLFFRSGCLQSLLLAHHDPPSFTLPLKILNLQGSEKADNPIS